MQLNTIVTKRFNEAIQKAFPESATNGVNLPVDVSTAQQEAFGHYQCNSAMKLAKILGLPPREVATKIVSHFETTPYFETPQIAGPGFINVKFNPQFLSQTLSGMEKDPRLGVQLVKDPTKVIVEFSSPNTAKEMHVGHLRSTIIGDCLARIFEFLGENVLRLNHIGDWGTQFGMLIAFIKKFHPEALEKGSNATLQELMQWYKSSKELFDKDPSFKKESQLEVVALQGGDEENLRVWNVICEISRRGYQEIYDLLDIKIVERGESFYNPMLADTVSFLEKKGIVKVSEGAKCIYIEGYTNREGEPLPLMIQKSDGGYNYATTDMAALRQRIDEEKAKRIIHVTDAGQSLHFAMIAKAAEMAGILDPKQVQVNHVPFGLVLGPDGKKFKTRSGETEKLIDLLLTAIEKAEAILNEKNPSMEEKERKETAKALGIGAVKYADLSCHRVSDYQFSYDRMLRFEGNTAAFLIYSYVRIQGIKRQFGKPLEFGSHPIVLTHPSEISLALKLLQLSETLEVVALELTPNRLTDYLYALAEAFNAFFRDCRVIGSPEEASRLELCELVGRTLALGLNLLGIQVVNKM